MNFLDSYIIVNDYVDSCSKESINNEPYKRMSSLKNSKDEIFQAHMLFFAHALFWRVISKEEYALHVHCFRFIFTFVDDSIVDQLCKILEF